MVEPPSRPVPAAGRGWLLALLVAVVTAYAALSRPPGRRLSDLDVYLGAVAALRNGESLYDFALGNAPFTYPPYAGLLMLPLTGMPAGLLRVLWTLATVATVALLARLAARHDARPEAWRTAPLIALVLFLSAPVASDVRYGQVSLFLALAVLVDVLRRGRAQGVLIGLAAAIKLTPLIFIPMLWFGGRRRAAVTAAVTFAGCGAAAAAILPADSWRYWTTEVRDVDRLGSIASPGNQSLNGALIRFGQTAPVRSATVLLLGGLVVVLALRRAARLAAAGDRLAGTVVVGAASIAFSPVSWTHHQVWLVLAAFLPMHPAWRGLGLVLMLLPVTAVWSDARLAWAVAVAALIPIGRRMGGPDLTGRCASEVPSNIVHTQSRPHVDGDTAPVTPAPPAAR